VALGIFVIFLAASVVAASTAMIFKPGDWYDGLNKPTWTPKKWMFPVGWTILYLASSYAAMRVALLPGGSVALAFWALQIALNTLWTPVFFGAHRIGAALVVIGALWLSIVAMIISFWPLDPAASYLIVPYLAWVSMAAALNHWIWRHNAG